MKAVPLILVALMFLMGCGAKDQSGASTESGSTVARQGDDQGGKAYQSPTDESTESPLPIGQPAPDAEFVGLDGQKVKLSSLKGKVVLIDFWATWCPPCREGLPVTDKLHRKYGKDLVVLAVSDEDKETVSAFLKEFSYAFPPMLDSGAKAAEAYRVQAIPTTVIIDAKGNLSSYVVGLTPETAILGDLERAGLKL